MSRATRDCFPSGRADDALKKDLDRRRTRRFGTIQAATPAMPSTTAQSPRLMLDHATSANVLSGEQITRLILKALLKPIISVSMEPSNRGGSGGLVGLRQLGIFRLRRARRGI
jgi:hypothetical protein